MTHHKPTNRGHRVKGAPLSLAELEARKKNGARSRPGNVAWTRAEQAAFVRTARKIRKLTPDALERLEGLMRCGEAAVERAACAEILDRGGFPRRTETEIDTGESFAGPLLSIVIGNHAKPGAAA